MNALILLSLGLFSVSLAPILIAWGEQELSGGQVVFGRLWIAALVYACYSLLNQFRSIVKREDRRSPFTSFEKNQLKAWIEMQWLSLKKKRSTIFSIFLLGLFFYINQLVWSWSIENTNIANSTVLHSFTPVFTALGAFLWLNQRFSRIYVLGIFIAIAGAVGLEIGGFDLEASHLYGDLAAVLSAVFYSVYLLILERLRGEIGAVNTILFYSMTGSFLALPVVIIQGDTLFPHSIHGWLAILMLSLICQVLGQVLIALSIQSLSSSIVSLAHLLCPCMSALAAWLIFGEKLTLASLIGALMILVGLFVSGLSQMEQIGEASIVSTE